MNLIAPAGFEFPAGAFLVAKGKCIALYVARSLFEFRRMPNINLISDKSLLMSYSIKRHFVT